MIHLLFLVIRSTNCVLYCGVRLAIILLCFSLLKKNNKNLVPSEQSINCLQILSLNGQIFCNAVLCNAEVHPFVKPCTYSCSLLSKMEVDSAKIVAFHRGTEVILSFIFQKLSSKNIQQVWPCFICLICSDNNYSWGLRNRFFMY